MAKLLDAGVNVALGTDGAASNNDLDMLGEMRTAALLAKGVSGKANAVPAMTALKMATINGAKALGIDKETGSMRKGKAADIVAINLAELETQPVYNALSQLVYAATRHQVTDVWVEGKQVLKNRQLDSFDLKVLRQKQAAWQEKIREK